MAEIDEGLIQEAVDKDKDLNILISSLPSKAEIVKKSKPREVAVIKALVLRLINLADLFDLHKKDLTAKIAKIEDMSLRSYFTQNLNQIIKNRQRYENLFAKYS
jgi:hypothetical protein